MATKKVAVSLDGAEKTVEVKEPPKKTCAMKDVLPATVIPLIAANPKNDVIRNLLLAHLKVPVPEECDTFEKVKEWIEYNIKYEAPESDFDRMQRMARDDNERRIRNSVQVAVSVEVTEQGRCSYYEDKAGQGTMPLTREAILREADSAENAAELFTNLETIMEEDGPENFVRMETTDNPIRYEDHDMDDESPTPEATITAAGKTIIKDVIRTANPELYRSLFGE